MALSGGGGIRQEITLEGGDEIIRKLERLGKTGQQSFDQIEQSSKGAAVGVKATGVAVDSLSTQFVQLNRQASALRKGIDRALGIGILGIVGAIGRFAGSIAESQQKLIDLSKETGASTRSIDGLRQAFRNAGQPASFATDAIAKLGEVAHKARLSNDELTKSLSRGATVMRGGLTTGPQPDVKVLRGGEVKAPSIVDLLRGPQVVRGGQPPPDLQKALQEGLADPLKALKVKPAAVGDPRDQIRFWGDMTTALTKLQGVNRDVAEEFAKATLGAEGWQQKLAGLQSVFKTMPASIEETKKKLEALGIEFDPNKPNQYRLAVEGLNSSWGRLTTSFGTAAFGPLATSINITADSLEKATGTAEAFGRMMSGFASAAWRGDWDTFGRGVGALGQAFVDLNAKAGEANTATFEQLGRLAAQAWQKLTEVDWTAAFAPLQTAANDVLTWMQDTFVTGLENIGKSAGEQFTAIGNAISSSVRSMLSTLEELINKGLQAAKSGLGFLGGGGGSAVPTPGFAGGGVVYGPGSGTSDSIIARLSHGEFVVNAAAAARNLSLLRAINDGILPSRPRAFATGGLVGAAAGGGTPVHLHLDGGEFALRGPEHVVDRLVKAAHRQHIRSAGVKPSWYGGR